MMSSSKSEKEHLLKSNTRSEKSSSLAVEATQPSLYTPVQIMEDDVSPEVEKVEEELKHSSERFRHSKSGESGSKKQSGKKLTFRNIEAVTVKKKGKRQEILKRVSGVARPGELTFIMGSSGAGKTTLLNILTGRNLKNIETHGEIIVNGREMHSVEMKKLSAYVQQDDVFIGMLTVRETLLFAANLRSPLKLDDEELTKIVDELLVMMSLKKCENTKVGSLSEKSLSRGERKRLAFACEILTDPPILFCDEPTSGLDSFMSHQVIKALRQLTNEGKTIVCTIHQPSTSVYLMADQLILLSQGHVAYAGPAKEVDAFFGRCGYPCPKFVSAPDHFMRVISHKSHETESEYTTRIERIVEEHRELKQSENSQSSSRREQPQVNVNFFPRTWICQFYHISHRSAIQLWRERSVLFVKLIQTLIMSLMIGGTYFRLTINRESLPSFKGFAFVTVQMMHMLFMMPAMTVFWKDYPVVVREYQSNMYSPTAYYLAKTTADSIQYLIFPVIFSIILLVMTSLPVHFFGISHYLAVNILLSLNSCSVGQSFSAICGNLSTGMTVLPIAIVPLMVFGGFLITYDAIPFYFLPFAWVSWYKYAFEAITIAYFREIDTIPGCTGSNSTVIANLNSTTVGYLSSTVISIANSTSASKSMSIEPTCSTGAAFISEQSFDVSNLLLDYIVIVLAILFWKVLGVLAFTWRIRRT
uniref:ABC transporter domain-containing protein n=1 Tax=Caenorhabditis japonica TaxID=281687 RepID=A0A8R1DL26_CAEJA